MQPAHDQPRLARDISRSHVSTQNDLWKLKDEGNTCTIASGSSYHASSDLPSVVFVQVIGFTKYVDLILVSPQVWEANVFEYVQDEGSQMPNEVRRGRESYDAQNLRWRFLEEVESFDERDYYDNIFLHKEVNQ